MSKIRIGFKKYNSLVLYLLNLKGIYRIQKSQVLSTLSIVFPQLYSQRDAHHREHRVQFLIFYFI